MKRALLIAAVVSSALASALACRHVPTGNWDVPSKPDAGTLDLSWGMR